MVYCSSGGEGKETAENRFKKGEMYERKLKTRMK
jgi:hypothetical protein